MGKTVFINCSPKRKMSISGFLMKCEGLMVSGEKAYLHLRTPNDHKPILDALKNADNAVFAVPLYVDSLPSHVLIFLKKLEEFSVLNGLDLNIYVIANNGFIEGRQNELLMQVMENFASRAGLNWRGGIGIGGGVMLNVIRVMIPVLFALMLLNLLLNGLQGGDILEPMSSFEVSAAEALFLSSGIIAYMARLSLYINRGTHAGKKYTRIMLPSFVFILMADVFFMIISVFQGGIFRGWLKKHRNVV